MSINVSEIRISRLTIIIFHIAVVATQARYNYKNKQAIASKSTI